MTFYGMAFFWNGVSRWFFWRIMPHIVSAHFSLSWFFSQLHPFNLNVHNAKDPVPPVISNAQQMQQLAFYYAEFFCLGAILLMRQSQPDLTTALRLLDIALQFPQHECSICKSCRPYVSCTGCSKDAHEVANTLYIYFRRPHVLFALFTHTLHAERSVLKSIEVVFRNEHINRTYK